MTIRSSVKSLGTVLALGVTMGSTLPAHAQWRDDDARNRGVITRQDDRRAPAPPVIAFRRSPRWVTVPGTRVYVVNRNERPGYDIFRYGSTYYIYDNGWWYRSNRWNGRFVAIDERMVPTAFYDVPRAEWRSYPSGWENRAWQDHRNRTGHNDRWHRDNGSREDNGRHRGNDRGHGGRRY